MLDVEQAKKMIEKLLAQDTFDERTLAKALNVYSKTLREILNAERDSLSKALALAIIKIYCNNNVDDKKNAI